MILLKRHCVHAIFAPVRSAIGTRADELSDRTRWVNLLTSSGRSLTVEDQNDRRNDMQDRENISSERMRLRETALSRWDNEGGAGSGGRVHPGASADGDSTDVPPLTNAQLVQLQIRVIALENVVMALMADASDRQLKLVREMSACISPRPGHVQHCLTIHAAARMVGLVERAIHFRTTPPTSSVQPPP